MNKITILCKLRPLIVAKPIRTFSTVEIMDVGFHFLVFKNLNIVLRISRQESIFTWTSMIDDGINYLDINDSRLIPAVKLEEQSLDL